MFDDCPVSVLAGMPSPLHNQLLYVVGVQTKQLVSVSCDEVNYNDPCCWSELIHIFLVVMETHQGEGLINLSYQSIPGLTIQILDHIYS